MIQGKYSKRYQEATRKMADVKKKYHDLVRRSKEYADKRPDEVPNYYDHLIDKLFTEHPWLHEALGL